eukprot:2794356-Pleurochrysis_carterae.AAC.3
MMHQTQCSQGRKGSRAWGRYEWWQYAYWRSHTATTHTAPIASEAGAVRMEAVAVGAISLVNGVGGSRAGGGNLLKCGVGDSGSGRG